LSENPIYNDGKKVTIGRNDFLVCEVRAIVAFKYMNKMFTVMRKIRDKNPTIDWDALGAAGISSALIGNLDDVSEILGESMVGIMAEACRVDEKGIGELALSEFIELFGEVVQAQTPAVRAFFSQRATLAKWGATLTSASPA